MLKDLAYALERKGRPSYGQREIESPPVNSTPSPSRKLEVKLYL